MRSTLASDTTSTYQVLLGAVSLRGRRSGDRKVIPPVDEEHSWRDLAQVVTDLRTRGASSKIVFHLD